MGDNMKEKEEENKKMDELEQYTIVDYLGFTVEEGEEAIAEVVAEVFLDPTPTADIESGLYVSTPIPDNIKKGRSHLLDGIIHKKGSEVLSDTVLLEEDETSELTNKPVRSKISVSFYSDNSEAITFSNVLSVFDREVIDAVSTLAESNQIMTPSMIYRMITGKDNTVRVVASQIQKVEQSMKRCSKCDVTIDITAKLKGAIRDIKEGETLQYSDTAISFQTISHSDGQKTTTYYKINSMPPFYKYAEQLGKISVIPLYLIDSPVTKTDTVIAVQSYLIRVIDEAKKHEKKLLVQEWDHLFQAALLGGKKNGRDEKHRTKNTVLKILSYWVAQGFIKGFESPPRKKELNILL